MERRKPSPTRRAASLLASPEDRTDNPRSRAAVQAVRDMEAAGLFESFDTGSVTD